MLWVSVNAPAGKLTTGGDFQRVYLVLGHALDVFGHAAAMARTCAPRCAPRVGDTRVSHCCACRPGRVAQFGDVHVRVVVVHMLGVVHVLVVVLVVVVVVVHRLILVHVRVCLRVPLHCTALHRDSFQCMHFAVAATTSACSRSSSLCSE